MTKKRKRVAIASILVLYVLYVLVSGGETARFPTPLQTGGCSGPLRRGDVHLDAFMPFQLPFLPMEAILEAGARVRVSAPHAR